MYLLKMKLAFEMIKFAQIKKADSTLEPALKKSKLEK